MARPVQYNITNKAIEAPIALDKGPEGFTGRGIFCN